MKKGNHIPFILLFLMILFVPVMLSQDINAGLIGYYPFKGNVDDHSGNGHHGIAYGNPVYEYDRWDYPNSSLVLNGQDDYVVFPVGDYKYLAISVWLKPFLKNDSAYIFDYGEGTFSSRIDAKTTATNPAYTVFHTLNNNYVFPNASMMYYTEWHHLYLDSGSETEAPKVYIDGYLDKNISKKFILKALSTFLYLGRKSVNVASCHYYYGEIDDLRIYNRPLSVLEINYLYALDPASLHKQDENKINIFHDYARNRILVENNGCSIENVQIIDAFGKLVYRDEFQPVILLSNLPKGIYFLKMTCKSDNAGIIYKFVKMSE